MLIPGHSPMIHAATMPCSIDTGPSNMLFLCPECLQSPPFLCPYQAVFSVKICLPTLSEPHLVGNFLCGPSTHLPFWIVLRLLHIESWEMQIAGFMWLYPSLSKHHPVPLSSYTCLCTAQHRYQEKKPLSLSLFYFSTLDPDHYPHVLMLVSPDKCLSPLITPLTGCSLLGKLLFGSPCLWDSTLGPCRFLVFSLFRHLPS